MCATTSTAGNAQAVAIIGGGVSGLQCADVLQRCGFSVVIFEKASAVGGQWAYAYAKADLQNASVQFHFPRERWPFRPDLHATAPQVQAYCQHAVAACKLNVRLNTEVLEARQADGGWLLRLSVNGVPAAGHERFDRLVVCNGLYNAESKQRLQIPGVEQFRGRVVTELDLQHEPEAVFEGKRVAVVGFGKTALDMAVLAHGSGCKGPVRHIFRGARWLLPRWIGGIHFSHLLWARISTVMMPAWDHPSGLETFLHKRLPGVVSAFWSMIEMVLTVTLRGAARVSKGDERGRAALRLVTSPDAPLALSLRSAVPVAPDNFCPLVASGAITPHLGEVAALTPDGVRLSDGSVLEGIDVLVVSVGSTPVRFPFLPPDLRSQLEGEPDGVQLYRHVVLPGQPTLGFGGFNHSFLHMPCAEVGALWLAALWMGHLQLPPVAQMRDEVDSVKAWKRASSMFECSRLTSVNTRFQQYLDIMCMDLGLNPYRKLPNVFAELLLRYQADDYAGLVDEFLAKVARNKGVPLGLRPCAKLT